MATTQSIQTDNRGRTNLGAAYAGQLFVFEPQENGSILLTPGRIVTDVDHYFENNPDIFDEKLTDDNTHPRKRR